MSGEGVMAAGPIGSAELAGDEEIGAVCEPASSGSIEAHFARLLDNDPVCGGNVSRTTVRALASYAEVARVLVDGDVAAERAACGAAMMEVRQRLAAIDMVHVAGVPICNGDSLALEIRRLDAAIEAMGAGLHRPALGGEAT